MGYTIQNSETGEVDYIYTDDSTTVELPKFDQETGEPLNGKLKVRYIKHKSFHIPKKYLRGTPCEEFDKQISGDYNENFPPHDIQVLPVNDKNEKPKSPQYAREDYLKMDGVINEIVLGYNKSSHHLLLIPTLFFFNIYLALLLGIIEMFLHWWAHHKNGLNTNKQIYFRSPLHLLTSQFCAVCRSESEMDIKLFDMLNKHMREARRSKTLRNVSKAIS
ncbi:uncharacterized protein LOC119667327 [Teleopsis dalmanni]|uniref:uncharacterized protein LOC119667327 n=1 Tax=Teleopsis dalmanni TaxID=139649 RepID=UPI0018CFE4AD|nr:uncharacterized protein LOC119667327 [Teleopsis dalmanni]XP_037932607.1 uncharacterized protein LOC119667327 [Teleopsis dalmanni]